MSQAAEWLSRWQRGQTGFHQRAVERQLLAQWPTLDVPADTRVLVPMCGKSLDVLWLIGAGCSVVGIDVSIIAIEELLLESGVPARRNSAIPPTQTFTAPRLTAICGDFFEMDRLELGRFSWIYDRAAFAAMASQHRAAYVKTLLQLTDIGSRILMILVEYPQREFRGPPFSIGPDELRQQFAPWFSIRTLDRVDTLASDARMRARGVTQLHEVCCLLERIS